MEPPFRLFFIFTYPVNAFLFRDQHIREYNLARAVERIPNLGIVHRVYALYYPKYAILRIDRVYYAIYVPEVGYVITNNSLSRQHGGRGLTAERRKRTGKIGHPSGRAMHAHNEHVLGQPSFFWRSGYRRTHR